MSVEILLVTLLLATQVHAEDMGKRCYEKDRAKAYNTLFKIQLDTFDGTKADLCWKNQEYSDLVQLYMAIDFLRNVRFNPTTYSNNLIPGILPTDYYAYIIQNISSMARGKDIKSSEDDGEADAALTNGTGAAKFYSYFFGDEQDIEDEASTVVHEARHRIPVSLEKDFHDVGERTGFSHVDCSRGEEKGETVGCDPDFLTYRGAYAVEVEFNARVYLFATNVEPMYKREARENALALLKEKFNYLGPIFRHKSRRRSD